MKKLILINGIILTPFQELVGDVLFLKDGKIEKVISDSEFSHSKDTYAENYKIIDVKGNFISPGFIDIHTHGANNVDATKGPYERMAEFLIKYGTTGFLPTFWNADISTLVEACKNISEFIRKQEKGARVLGINSEGPYLNPKFGAQEPVNSIAPIYSEYSRLIESAEGNLRLMTVSPEIKGAAGLIKYLRLNDIVAAICYTEMSVEELYRSIEIGVSHIGHIFDGFGESITEERGVKPSGLGEELLVCDDLAAEVIADRKGIHVHPAWLKIIVRCKGIDKIILITDSRDIAGNPPGIYSMSDGFKAIIEEGEDVVRIAGSRDLAGCIMTIDKAIGNIIKHTGIDLKDAVRMATYNPAKAIKLANRKGEIKAGMDADITVFDENINVKLTMINGCVEYDNL